MLKELLLIMWHDRNNKKQPLKMYLVLPKRKASVDIWRE